MDDTCARWSDLLPELWMAIGKHLDTHIDVLRCRGVCRSLRASFPPFNAVSPLLPLYLLSLPNVDDADSPVKDILLARKIIYRFSPLDRHQTTNAASSSSSAAAAAAAKVWFAIVDSTNEGKLRILRPLYLSNLKFTYEALRDEMNLLEFRIHELAKSYTIVNTEGVYVSDIRKVVMFPDSPWIDKKNCAVLAIFRDGKLGFAKLRDNKWTMFEKHNFAGGDVIVYRGKFYAVDRRGRIFSIDSWSMELSQISPPMSVFGKQKHLVECGGEVYVVDRFDDFSDSEDDVDDGGDNFNYNYNDDVDSDSDNDSESEEDEEDEADFEVYRVDLNGEYCRRELEVVKNLGNEAIVLGNKREGSFSVSGTEFEGIQGNCIYYPRRTMMMKKGF
ncbi:putative F-box protein At1g65770 [Benincasa hispida]|uniref:putative F-box protein At1g65770 n=1 Tax=Benincasa hispida TaxID=102211 RepID=UPI001902B862|nr:putative F-box protein At1g65770 [Benincasa hispida]